MAECIVCVTRACECVCVFVGQWFDKSIAIVINLFANGNEHEKSTFRLSMRCQGPKINIRMVFTDSHYNNYTYEIVELLPIVYDQYQWLCSQHRRAIISKPWEIFMWEFGSIVCAKIYVNHSINPREYSEYHVDVLRNSSNQKPKYIQRSPLQQWVLQTIIDRWQLEDRRTHKCSSKFQLIFNYANSHRLASLWRTNSCRQKNVFRRLWCSTIRAAPADQKMQIHVLGTHPTRRKKKWVSVSLHFFAEPCIAEPPSQRSSCSRTKYL